MAYSIVWPSSLPENPQKGFSETGGALILRTQTDMGPAKMRYRGQSPQVLSISFIMTSAQVTTLEDFIKGTLKGIKRFGFKHPRTYIMSEVRMIPQSKGDLYTLAYTAPGYWNVTLQLEILT